MKRPSSTRRVLASALPLAAVLSAGASGCRTSSDESRPTHEAAPASPYSGDVVAPPNGPLAPSHDDADFRVEVGRPETCVAEAPFLPPSGHERLAVPVRVTAKSARSVPVGPLAFSLENEDGARLRPILLGCGEPFDHRTIAGAESAGGTVVFDVPQGERAYRVVYEPFVVGRPTVRVWLGFPSAL